MSRNVKELAHVFGGKVAPGLKREYGKAMVNRVENCDSKLFEGMPKEFQMWMSHGDKLHVVPENFKACGTLMNMFYSKFVSIQCFRNTLLLDRILLLCNIYANWFISFFILFHDNIGFSFANH